MRQLQAWWTQHAFYPRRAARSQESGTVTLRLTIRADGNIWRTDVAQSSGSDSLDAAAQATFKDGFVRAFNSGEPDATLELALHYVLLGPGISATQVASRPFAITNEPVHSVILETMLQRTCTGVVVKEGIRNHPAYGGHYPAEAVFFRKPDGSPWVRFNEGGEPLTAPVTQAGHMIQWTGQLERPRRGVNFYYQYTVWPNGENAMTGKMKAFFFTEFRPAGINTGGTVDLTCATEIVSQPGWSALAVSKFQVPSADPP